MVYLFQIRGVQVKHIPNIISVFRIFASISMLFIEPFSAVFILIYIFCGASDILDGYIARKHNICSRRGAVIDSLADLIFCIALLYIILPYLNLQIWLIALIAAIIIIKIASLIVGFIRFRSFAMLHTYLNKFSGIFLFICIFIYLLFHNSIYITISVFPAAISALEELYINIVSSEHNKNIKSFLNLKK